MSDKCFTQKEPNKQVLFQYSTRTRAATPQTKNIIMSLAFFIFTFLTNYMTFSRKQEQKKFKILQNFLAFLSKIVIKNNQSIGIVKIFVYNFALFIKSKKQTSFYFPV